MRVISLVPSLTETLLHCGVNVVGRTRFCIHPADSVRNIPAVGGTKEVNWDRCAELNPDLVVFDREENTREMAETCPFHWVATHITAMSDVPGALRDLAAATSNQSLESLADDWAVLAERPPLKPGNFSDLPGCMKTIGHIDQSFKQVEYMIWREPWMAVSRETFIGSVLDKLGFADRLPDYSTQYPEVEGALPRADTFYIFSSEPFPFERYIDELSDAGFNGALVDGELFSWFGVRSYELLKQYLDKTT